MAEALIGGGSRGGDVTSMEKRFALYSLALGAQRD
jgi:hypothetical protein